MKSTSQSFPVKFRKSGKCEICSVQTQFKLLLTYMYFIVDSFFVLIVCINVNKLESHSQNEKRKKHNIKIQLQPLRGFPGGSAVRNLLANAGEAQGLWIGSLGQEDPLEEGMATHSSILAWRIPWREEPGWLQSMGCKESGYDRATKHARAV